MSITLIRDLTDSLLLRGATLQEDVADNVTQWHLDMGTDRATQLQVTLEDFGMEILGSGLVSLGGDVVWRDLDLKITVVEVGPGQIMEQVRFSARSAGVQALKAQKGERVWGGLSPTDLVREESAKVGLSFIGETSAPRSQIARRAEPSDDDPEDTWDVFQRLASELGFICFETSGTVVFGRPSWLVGRSGVGETHTWQWPAPTRAADGEHVLQDVPQCRVSDDALETTVIGELLVADALDYRPGHAVTFSGINGFAGTYIVTEVDLDPGRELATVSLSTPVDPAPQPATAAGGGSVSPVVEGFVAKALAQAGDRYVWGAGRTANEDPDAFDCSGLVYWAATQSGIPNPGSTAYQQFDRIRSAGRLISVEDALRTRGALLFMGDGTGTGRNAITHVAISLGDGNTIEARGRRYGVGVFGGSRGFSFAGLMPGLSY